MAIAWFYVIRQLDWRIALVAVFVLGAGFAAYRGWKNAPAGHLAWDGQSWRWESPNYQTGVAEHQLSVLVDFQNVLLLRIQNQAKASLWLWVEREAFPERWLDLRRAVYSPARVVPVSSSMQSIDSAGAKP